MDIDVSRWILEFLLREGVDDRVVTALVRVLPVPNSPSSFKKTMLLRKIESVTRNGVVTQEVLDLLEYIEELDYQEGMAPSDAMKAAYSAVAVDCTLRLLDSGEYNEANYFEIVKKFWKGSASKMEMCKNSGLFSDELCKWKDEFEAALWDSSLKKILQIRRKEIDAVNVVRVYVEEQWDIMGPSFLKLLAETVSYDTLKELMGLVDVQMCNEVADKDRGLSVAVNDLPVVDGEKDRDLSGALHELPVVDGEKDRDLSGYVNDSPVVDGDEDTMKASGRRRQKQLANRRSSGSRGGGAKIFDSEDLGVGTLNNKYGCPPTTEFIRVKEALRSSSLELKELVNDPLPEALRFVGTKASTMGRENTCNEPLVDSLDAGEAGNKASTMGRENTCNEPSVDTLDAGAAYVSINKSAEAVQASENNLRNPPFSNQNAAHRPNLLERNSTARTYEWDDSIDSDAKKSANPRKIHLPSPKKRVCSSPLKKYEDKKFVKRRKMKKWSQLEEDTLRTGVQKYGMGQWKFILNCYRQIFEERTEVDLKDKWRNMMR